MPNDSYPGGKAGAGVWQRIVNQIPPHDVWISGFLGNCAVTRNIRPAAVQVLIDLDRRVLRRWQPRLRPSQRLYQSDAIAWLWVAFGLGAPDGSREYATAAAAAEFPGRPWEPGAVAFFRGLLAARSTDASCSVAGSGAAGSRDPVPPRVFVYLDPPYLPETRGKDRIYRHELDRTEHAALLSVVRRLPCPCLLHGYPSPLYDTSLSGWRTFTFQAMTRGGMRTEQCWANYPEPSELHDYSQVGGNKRQRERIRRRCKTWSAALARAGTQERGAILQAIRQALGECPT